jgi:hypothetical protein
VPRNFVRGPGRQSTFGSRGSWLSGRRMTLKVSLLGGPKTSINAIFHPQPPFSMPRRINWPAAKSCMNPFFASSPENWAQPAEPIPLVLSARSGAAVHKWWQLIANQCPTARRELRRLPKLWARRPSGVDRLTNIRLVWWARTNRADFGRYSMRAAVSHVLWIGNAKEARDVRAVLALGIAAVVDLAMEEPPILLPRDIVSFVFH